jgi:hypothetical protein
MIIDIKYDNLISGKKYKHRIVHGLFPGLHTVNFSGILTKQFSDK